MDLPFLTEKIATSSCPLTGKILLLAPSFPFVHFRSGASKTRVRFVPRTIALESRNIKIVNLSRKLKINLLFYLHSCAFVQIYIFPRIQFSDA